ncbi:MAG TPA: hypothetical protein DER32_00620, partial [Deinococcus radiodurans]|nr:hypothetical protein [Deinococcus radiodurans]
GEMTPRALRTLTRLGLSGLCLGGGALAAGLTLALGGDINLARGAYQPGGQPFAPLAGALRADVVLANLESPLTNRPKATSGIDLRASPAAVAALRPFTALSTENNHAGDGGEAGRRQNEQVLRGSGLVPVSRQVTWLNVKGVNLALLAYLDDGRSPPPLAEVRRAAAQADLVVVLPHWGAEYNGVTARQRQQARALVDAGAGLVVGSGPHVLQGHEWLGRALVLYSLGNLLFDQPYPATWAGAVVHVTLQQGKMQACAFPTFSRAGRVQPGRAAERTAVRERLGLPLCPASEEQHATI